MKVTTFYRKLLLYRRKFFRDLTYIAGLFLRMPIKRYFRLLDMPKDELGVSATRKFDIEAWMPGRNLYGEVSSASNCTNYQSQRLNVKFREQDDKLNFVHTCNGTVLASTRAIIALLETHQNTVSRAFRLFIFGI